MLDNIIYNELARNLGILNKKKYESSFMYLINDKRNLLASCPWLKRVSRPMARKSGDFFYVKVIHPRNCFYFQSEN